MNEQRDIFGVLDYSPLPAFCVREGIIQYANTAARGLLIETGAEIAPMLLTGRDDYEAFGTGSLYLSVAVSGCPMDAVVTVCEAGHIFTLDQPAQQGELKALSLAARELRTPLSGLMNGLEELMADEALREDPTLRAQTARMNRSLFQLLRTLSNMSDAGTAASLAHMEMVDMVSLFREIFEKADGYLQKMGQSLEYQVPSESLYCLADPRLLERGFYNLLSNSLKNSGPSGQIRATLSRKGRMLHLTVQDSGDGIGDELLPSVFSRYLRQPSIEDANQGLGLGMVLIRSAAAAHGGTVLVTRPPEGGTRITVALAIRQNTDNLLRSPMLSVDYSAERDHPLLELADCLPAECYDLQNLL